MTDREKLVQESKKREAKNLRFKRPALSSMGWDTVRDELNEIAENCENVKWFEENDEETLLNALDGDEDDLYEFKIAFADLCGKAESLQDAIENQCIDEKIYNDCTVGLIGNRYRSVGFDDYEEDYYGLTGFEQELAYTDAGKRITALTKPKMLSTIGQCVGLLIAFLDLRQSYDYLKATMDILRDENTSIIEITREINGTYEAADRNGYSGEDAKKFDKLICQLPDRIWVE